MFESVIDSKLDSNDYNDHDSNEIELSGPGVF